jgi:hypothetical protein
MRGRVPWPKQVVHQGGFLATRAQLATVATRSCLRPAYHPGHWFYGTIESVDSQLYFECGFMKVVPLEVRGTPP